MLFSFTLFERLFRVMADMTKPPLSVGLLFPGSYPRFMVQLTQQVPARTLRLNVGSHCALGTQLSVSYHWDHSRSQRLLQLTQTPGFMRFSAKGRSRKEFVTLQRSFGGHRGFGGLGRRFYHVHSHSSITRRVKVQLQIGAPGSNGMIREPRTNAMGPLQAMKKSVLMTRWLW